MQNLMKDLEALLEKEPSLLSDGEILKNAVIERALKMDAEFLALLMQSELIKRHFFPDIEGTLVFDKVKFQEFVSNKAFLPDSYTAFKNRIGLMDGADYLKKSSDVVLAWPYKDCVLEGGMEKEDKGQDEVFWNTTLAPDDITRLFEPKVLTGFERWDVEAVAEGKPKSVERIGNEHNLLIKGNNLLVLHSLKARFAEKIDLIYIDPPYNPSTKTNTFLYNNRFNHSSWLAFMKNRLEVAKQLLTKNGSLIVAIDDNEFYFLGVMLDELFPDHEVHCVTIEHNPRGVQGTNFSYTHEFAFFVIPKGLRSVGYRRIPESEISWRNLRDNGGESLRSDAKNCFYPIKVKDGNIIGFGHVLDDDIHPPQSVEHDNYMAVFPIDRDGVERKWRYARQSVEEVQHLLKADLKNGKYEIKIGKDFGHYRTVWKGSRYDANEHGTKLLNDLVPECGFSYPKSLWTVFDCLKSIVGNKKQARILDFFAGSGTTGHAVMELNKADGGNRKFILVEQLDYIEDTTKKRLLEVLRREAPLFENTTLVYAEMMKWNAVLLERIRDASTQEDIAKMYEQVKATGYLRHNVDLSKFDTDDFAALALEDQKKALIDCLDMNHLYVNLGEIGDEAYCVSEENLRLNRAFYEGKA